MRVQVFKEQLGLEFALKIQKMLFSPLLRAYQISSRCTVFFLPVPASSATDVPFRAPDGRSTCREATSR